MALGDSTLKSTRVRNPRCLYPEYRTSPRARPGGPNNTVVRACDRLQPVARSPIFKTFPREETSVFGMLAFVLPIPSSLPTVVSAVDLDDCTYGVSICLFARDLSPMIRRHDRK